MLERIFERSRVLTFIIVWSIGPLSLFFELIALIMILDLMRLDSRAAGCVCSLFIGLLLHKMDEEIFRRYKLWLQAK